MRVEAKTARRGKAWLEGYCTALERNYRRLEAVLEEMKAAEETAPRRKRAGTTEGDRRDDEQRNVDRDHPSDREVQAIRRFNARRDLVFKALTTPDL